jgi:hypothetical protein
MQAIKVNQTTAEEMMKIALPSKVTKTHTRTGGSLDAQIDTITDHKRNVTCVKQTTVINVVLRANTSSDNINHSTAQIIAPKTRTKMHTHTLNSATPTKPGFRSSPAQTPEAATRPGSRSFPARTKNFRPTGKAGPNTVSAKIPSAKVFRLVHNASTSTASAGSQTLSTETFRPIGEANPSTASAGIPATKDSRPASIAFSGTARAGSLLIGG